MASQSKLEPQNPLILRCHRLMEAFAKSDDERDFYLDRLEGFIIYADLDKSQEELDKLDEELSENNYRYCLLPKLTFYETKKIMEGFVNEKVYDIDTKEKLIDIIQSKEAKENFIEFIFDHHSEFDKWQQYYQERSRIRIIEWLRNNKFQFVFEEDLDLGKGVIEKLKKNLFLVKAPKDILNARKQLFNKAKTYYSNEALNPRPKRGRPPKQVAKAELEPQLTPDVYTTISPPVRPFVFSPDNQNISAAFTFSPRFEADEKMIMNRKSQAETGLLDNLNQKLATIRQLSSKWTTEEVNPKAPKTTQRWQDDEKDVDDEEEDFEEEGDSEIESDWDDEEDEDFVKPKKKTLTPASKAKAKPPVKKAPAKAASKPAPKKPASKTNGKKVAPIKVAKKVIKPALKASAKPAAKKPVKKLPPPPPKGKARR